MPDESTAPLRYVSEEWKGEIVGVPAMFMALGVFLRYPGKYMLEYFLEPALSRSILMTLTVFLTLFAVYVAYRFGAQFRADRRVLWDYSVNHLRIGTWVAGVNIMAVLLFPISPIIAKITHAFGLLLWGSYITWIVRMAVRGELRGGNLSGTVFLTTVATQSVVVVFMTIFGEHVSEFLPWLIMLNVLGIIFYWISFALMWVAGGFVEPLLNWVPQNNITHGALSITMLAAQMIEESMPGSLSYFHLVIQVAWVITSLFFLSSLFYELYLILSRKKQLLGFQLGNYARNFTYSMFFACSFYGYVYSHQSVMKDILNPSTLLAMGFVALFVNLWELTHQSSIVLFRRTRMNQLFRFDSENE